MIDDRDEWEIVLDLYYDDDATKKTVIETGFVMDHAFVADANRDFVFYPYSFDVIGGCGGARLVLALIDSGHRMRPWTFDSLDSIPAPVGVTYLSDMDRIFFSNEEDAVFCRLLLGDG